jgi:hypothetical protein
MPLSPTCVANRIANYPKLCVIRYSLHSPEVERIDKGKARAPYEFGCKMAITTPATALAVRAARQGATRQSV